MITIETDLTISNTRVWLDGEEISKHVRRVILDAISGDFFVERFVTGGDGKHYIDPTTGDIASELLTSNSPVKPTS